MMIAKEEQPQQQQWRQQRQQEQQNITAAFVYGTLMRGEANHRLVSSAKKIMPATVQGRLYALVYGYPAMIDGHGQVHGELYFFDNNGIEAVLSRLDYLEGYRPATPETSLFLRKIVEVTTDDGRVYSAYTYLAGPHLVQRLGQIGHECPGGRWQ